MVKGLYSLLKSTIVKAYGLLILGIKLLTFQISPFTLENHYRISLEQTQTHVAHISTSVRMLEH